MAESDYTGLFIECGEVLFKTVLTQPLEFVRVLMTIGYEPAPPIETQHFGKIILRYPGLVSYAVHVYNVDGITGFLPGLKPRILIAILRHSTEKTVDHYLPSEKVDRIEQDPRLHIKSKLKVNALEFIRRFSRDVVYSVAQIIVTHPFHVVACRTIAQFVGRETKYDDVWSSLRIIHGEQGISGLYSGVMPRVIRDVTHILVASSVIFLIKTFFKPRNHIMRLANVMTMISKHLTYSLHVVTTCMAVNDQALLAGSPPYVPIYTGGWYDCYKHLQSQQQLKRGQFPLFRIGILRSQPSIITEASIFDALNGYGPGDTSEYTKSKSKTGSDTPDSNEEGGKIAEVLENLANVGEPFSAT